MEKYLIINPFGIGDALFATPVIRALKNRYPGCFIGYWCNERVGDLLKNNPKIAKVFSLSRGDIKRIYKDSYLKRLTALFKLISEIRKEKFDAAFDLSLDSRYGLWSLLAGIKKRVGLDYKNRCRFLTDKICLNGSSGRHVIEYNLDVLKLINVEPEGKSPELVISEEDRGMARNILKKYGVVASDILVGMAPGGGASWGRDAIYKQWPVEKFAEVAIKAAKELGAKVVLLGSAEERPLAEVVEKMGQFIDLTGKLSLNELTAVISELKLLICNDGGLLHMAVALGVNTVSMFGPVDERIYGPYPPSERHIVIKKDLSCRPCYKDFRFAGCSNNRRCLKDITVEEVFEKVKSLL
ncbi:MAG: lipopolysaccharide heptosyltransferase II [Candidatus Omnitrophota bacterium]|jgi:lipopolysaccharide heptosyltransferase II